MERIALRIKGIRKLRKLTQKQLAEMCGVSIATISRIEIAENTDIATIQKIEKALGVALY